MSRTTSVVTKSEATLTESRLSIYKHPLWRPGTKFILDFSDEYGAINLPNGAVTVGDTVQDLALTPKVGTFSSTAFSYVTANKAISTAAGLTSQRLRLGAAGDFGIPTGNEFLFLMWLHQTGTASANVPICYLGPSEPTTGNACQIFVSTGSGGNTPTLQVGTGSGVRSQSLSAGALDSAPTQIGLRFRPSDGLIQRYINGASGGSATGGALTLQDGSAMFFDITARFNGRIYCAQLVDITASEAAEIALGRTPLTVAQHVAADYQFGLGTLAGSPRPAYI
jgi:hypothetical protein